MNEKCLHRPKTATRQDKYGQTIQLTCGCGLHTTWHTEKWMAELALYQIHADTWGRENGYYDKMLDIPLNV